MLIDREALTVLTAVTGGEAPGFPELALKDVEYADAVARMVKNGLLLSREEELIPSGKAGLMAATASSPDAYICLSEGQGKSLKKLGIYIRGESIACLSTAEGDDFNMNWLPFLPLAVGEYANWLGDFEGQDARSISVFGKGESGELARRIEISDGEGFLDGEKAELTDCVNALTGWLAGELSRSMLKRGYRDE